MFRRGKSVWLCGGKERCRVLQGKPSTCLQWPESLDSGGGGYIKLQETWICS